MKRDFVCLIVFALILCLTAIICSCTGETPDGTVETNGTTDTQAITTEPDTVATSTEDTSTEDTSTEDISTEAVTTEPDTTQITTEAVTDAETTEEVKTMEKDIFTDGYNTNMIVGFDEQGHTISAVSSAREGKQVGIFYFLWLGQPFATDIYDVSKITEENGKAEVFYKGESTISPVNQAYWWSKPQFGYYNSSDEWIIRKHMEMLTDAGVDFLVFDTTNAVTYDNVAKRVMKVITELRAEGWDAPQVVFYTHSYSIQTMNNLYQNIYSQNVYPDAWYLVDGKPMIIGYSDPAGDIAATGSDSYKPVLSDDVRDFFYIREARWPNDPVVDMGWPYTEWQYPQPLNTNMISVSIATHPMVPFSFSLTHKNWCNWGRGYNVETGKNIHDDIMKGTFFDSQWKTVYEKDPDFVFVTGWNEWVAYKSPYGGEYMLCDNVDMEYSRDAEPMSGGYEDAYFVQMIDRIRRYKFVPMDGYIASTVKKTIDIGGSASQWDEVNAVYRRVGTDDGMRRSYGGSKTVYFDVPAVRNNILEVRVTCDGENLYFMIKTENNITAADGDGWMNLFIGCGTPEQGKGWEGYEYAINRSRDGGSAVIEQLASDYSGKNVGNASYTVSGNVMQLSVPRASVGLADGGDFYFKVADGIDDPAEIMNYYSSGRSLPMGRLSYLYQIGK